MNRAINASASSIDSPTLAASSQPQPPASMSAVEMNTDPDLTDDAEDPREDGNLVSVQEIEKVANRLDISVASLMGKIRRTPSVGENLTADALGAADADNGAGLPDDDEAPVESFNSHRSAGTKSPLLQRPPRTSGLSSDSDRSGDRRPKARRGVTFAAPSELNSVTAYEIDNSIYISIEYSRPVIGWFILLFAFILGSVSGMIGSGRNAAGVNPYVAATWESIGQVIVSLFVCTGYFSFVNITNQEQNYLKSKRGIILLAAIAIIYSLMRLAHQATIHLTGHWRLMSLTSVHPAIITMFGKVFKNTVFLNEVCGTVFLLGGYVLAMLPADISQDTLGFASVLSVAQGIYTASFLFMCAKGRANAPIVVVFTVATVASLIFQLVVCGVEQGISFSSSGSTSDSVGAFFSDDIRNTFLINALCSTLGLLSYLVTLRFLPPVTVSAVMVVQQLMSELLAYWLLFNPDTAVWPTGIETPTPAPFPFTNPPPPPNTQHGGVYSIYFSIGAPICALAAGYIVYVSSVKRAKVDMWLKSLSRRRRPRNPHARRGSQDSVGTPTDPGETPRSVAIALARERQAEERQRRRESGQRVLRNMSREGTSPPHNEGSALSKSGGLDAYYDGM